jgi:phage terminase large subunit
MVVIIADYRGVDKTLDQLAGEIPEAIPVLKLLRIPIWCDSSRPESIAFLKARGLNCRPAVKWPNSVIEGIERLKTGRILIVEGCEGTIKDFSHYSWELDANEEPIGEPEKKNDHAPDALRYGVWRWIKSGSLTDYRHMRDPYL